MKVFKIILLGVISYLVGVAAYLGYLSIGSGGTDILHQHDVILITEWTAPFYFVLLIPLSLFFLNWVHTDLGINKFPLIYPLVGLLVSFIPSLLIGLLMFGAGIGLKGLFEFSLYLLSLLGVSGFVFGLGWSLINHSHKNKKTGHEC